MVQIRADTDFFDAILKAVALHRTVSQQCALMNSKEREKLFVDKAVV